MKKKIHRFFIIPFLVCISLVGISSLGGYKKLEQKVYDFFLLLSSVDKNSKSILLLEAGPISVARNGFQSNRKGLITRNNLADGLILLKEFAAGYAVINQEFETESMYQRTPKQFANDLQKLFYSISHEPGEKDLSKHLDKIYSNEDEYFTQAARFFGNVFLGIKIDLNPGPETERQMSESGQIFSVYDKISLHDPEVIYDGLPVFQGIHPLVPSILAGSKGVGYIDNLSASDGVIRKVRLIGKYKNYYIPELGFSALLDWLGQPKVIVLKDQLILKKVIHPQQGLRDISIPLTEDKSMLLHWPDYEIQKNWRRLTFEDLESNNRLEERLLHQLNLMNAKGYLAVYRKSNDWLNLYSSAQELLKKMLSKGIPDCLSDYQEKRNIFFTEVQNFLKEDVEHKVIQSMKEILASGALNQTDLSLYRTIQREIPEDFKNARTSYEQLSSLRKIFSEYLPGSFCLIGCVPEKANPASVLPPVFFQQNTSPAFIQANVVNTILTDQFLIYLSWWYALLAAFIASGVITFIGIKFKPRWIIFLGCIFTLSIILGSAVVFLFMNILLNPLMPFMASLFTSIIIFIYQFSEGKKQKDFLYHLFFPSFSKEAWIDFLKNKDGFSLRGERKYLTAFISEIQDFTAFTDLLNPGELVNLLNSYFAEIGNLILEQKGAVNKFDKSAIVALFGAPLPLTDHARRACFSAVKIKRVEKYLSDQLSVKKLVTTSLLTCIGISTGEMITGNMGTEKKIDYTAFGSHFSLAQSLKDMNCYYKTKILIEESTYLEGGYDFYVRMLDKIRLTGIKNPIRIYELIDEKHRVDANIREGVEVFHEGMHQFEKREWDKAEKMFLRVMRVIPNDYPAKLLALRCQKYKKNPPPIHWNNVFSLK